MSFARKYAIYLTFAVVALFLSFAPSCDSLEEAHGIIKSGRYIIGNGILVGAKVHGKPRIAFVTCRHVIDASMLATRRSFLDSPSSENIIYLNKRPWGFWYKGISNIDPKRWHTIADSGQDVAWLILSDEEVSRFAGGNPSYVTLPEDPLDAASGVLRPIEFCAKNVGVGTTVSLMHIMAPVTGHGGPACKIYWHTFFNMPFTSAMNAIVYSERGKILDQRSDVTMFGEDAHGIHSSTLQRAMIVDISAHDNMSGAPLFAAVDGSRKLIGILNAAGHEGTSICQPLDSAVFAIRESLSKENDTASNNRK